MEKIEKRESIFVVLLNYLIDFEHYCQQVAVAVAAAAVVIVVEVAEVGVTLVGQRVLQIYFDHCNWYS